MIFELFSFICYPPKLLTHHLMANNPNYFLLLLGKYRKPCLILQNFLYFCRQVLANRRNTALPRQNRGFRNLLIQSLSGGAGMIFEGK